MPANDVITQRFPFPGRVLQGGFLANPAVEEAPQQQDPNADPAKGDQPKGDQPKDEGNNRAPQYHPGLVVRAFAGDTGERKLALGSFFWESPDMWVTAPDGSNIPIAGVVNQVSVHVWNLGVSPAAVHVDLYWCDPSVGVNLAKSHHIGSLPNPGTQALTLYPGQHHIFTIDWLVEFANGGHECLVAHAYDPVSDNLVAPFDPMSDSHVGQYNIFQIRVPPGHQLNLNFFLSNLSLGMATSEIHIEAVRGEQLQGFAQTLGHDFLPETTGIHAAVTQVQNREAHPTINLREHLAAAVFRETSEPVPQRFVRNLLNQALQAVPPTAAPQKEHYALKAEHRKQASEPFKGEISAQHDAAPVVYTLHPMRELALTLTISVPRHARKALYQAYRVVETSNGQVTGGITYLVRVE